MADLIDTLNDLIATCRDSEEGLGKAAKGTHNDALRNHFMGIARERADFADELAEEVRNAGGAPAVSGHLSGIQHRGWRELETSLRPRSAADFVEACVIGEENTLRHYEHALTIDLPSRVRPIVERQRLAVRDALSGLAQVEHVSTAR